MKNRIPTKAEYLEAYAKAFLLDKEGIRAHESAVQIAEIKFGIRDGEYGDGHDPIYCTEEEYNAAVATYRRSI